MNMKQLSIIIPAYNEENRIGQTMQSYLSFFNQLSIDKEMGFEIIIVLNGCTDNTVAVAIEMQEKWPNIFILDLKEAGKGLAIKAGFADALKRNNDFIGFVDADMATEPQYFYALLQQIDGYDGAIASRYMATSQVFPPRPWIKRWGSLLIYESLITVLFGIRFQDYQCGAKIFKRSVIESILPSMTMTKWAFDVEILYLCKKFGYKILEVSTVWYDKAGSKLKIYSGFAMLSSLIKLRLRHSRFKRFFSE